MTIPEAGYQLFPCPVCHFAVLHTHTHHKHAISESTSERCLSEV